MYPGRRGRSGPPAREFLARRSAVASAGTNTGAVCDTASPWLDGTLDSVPIVRDGRGALWELSRGCPFSCSYCYESRGEKTVREIPLPRLEKELEYFSQKGIERIFVLDPTYNASKKRALSLLALIEQKALDIHFNFEIRAELVDQDLAQAFSRIPCSLQIGLQTVNETSLSLVNRPVDFKKFAAGVTRLNTAGIVFGMDLMYGLPGDNLKGFKRSSIMPSRGIRTIWNFPSRRTAGDGTP